MTNKRIKRETPDKLIKRLRKKKGLSQTELAHLLGVNGQFISNIERQICAFPPSWIVRLSRFFKVSKELFIESLLHHERAQIHDAIKRSKKRDERRTAS